MFSIRDLINHRARIGQFLLVSTAIFFLARPYVEPLVTPEISSWATTRAEILIVITTPTGVKLGSGVIEADITKYKSKDLPNKVKVTGDAIPIDLDDGRTIFMILDDTWANAAPWVGNERIVDFYQSKEIKLIEDSWVEHAPSNLQELISKHRHMYPYKITSKPTYSYGRATRHGFYAEKEEDLSEPFLPVFAVLEDPNDVSTARKMDPFYPEATLGEGYTVRSIRVRMTSDPITTGIEKRFPWINSWTLKFPRIWRDGDSEFANSLNKASFTR